MYSALYYTWVGHSVVDLQYLWTPLNAFCPVLHMRWTLCCWSTILVDTLGCIDLQYMCPHLDAFSSVPHIVWTFCCWSAMDTFGCILLLPHIVWTFCCWSAILVDNFGCILLCTSHSLDIMLLICNTYIDPFGCILFYTSHGLDILLLICNTCGHPWMHSALYFTGVGHSVDFIDLHYKWIFLASFCV